MFKATNPTLDQNLGKVFHLSWLNLATLKVVKIWNLEWRRTQHLGTASTKFVRETNSSKTVNPRGSFSRIFGIKARWWRQDSYIN